MPPLCKGRWHGEAVTEGLLPLSRERFTEAHNPSVASRQLPLPKGVIIKAHAYYNKHMLICQ